jgi:hypothetical protein
MLRCLNRRAAVAALASCLVIAGCSGSAAKDSSSSPPPSTQSAQGSPSTGNASSTTPGKPLATQTATIPEGDSNGQSVLQLDVLSLQRDGSGQVTLRLRFKNVGSGTFSFLSMFGTDRLSTDLSAVTLLDLQNNKEYLPGVDSNNDCLCTSFTYDMDPGLSVQGYVIFGSPPRDVSTLTVVVPNFQPINVPVS